MENIVHNQELQVYVTSKNCQNSYHKLCQYVNKLQTDREQTADKFNNSICKFAERFGSGNSYLRINKLLKNPELVHFS